MRNVIDKLMSRGAASLTDEELVAVIIAESMSDERAVELARELLAGSGGDVMSLVEQDAARLRMVGGLGRMRALRLKAVAECGRRVAVSRATNFDNIGSDSDVVRIMEPQLGGLQHEECWALYLASSGRVLERMRISQGGVQATVVDCRLIIKRALELLAVQIVLVHNHPSGSAEPSEQDRVLTERVAEAARLFEIRLLDHVIIARGSHFSFRGHALLG
ncbi:MAG: DNA repair protein RadC [Alistipes sp.]|uniref:RadC family protein n=1 Tax=Alistipes sp. TaxID=1872444 RepID=UPI001B4A2B4E|nr:DNA repair protein RadC [Alistipes sp.]